MNIEHKVEKAKSESVKCSNYERLFRPTEGHSEAIIPFNVHTIGWRLRQVN